MSLTDIRVRNAKAGEKPIKLSDGQGLQLHISTAGGKVWNLAFRHDGRQQKLRIGAYPAISLAEARSARDAARKLLEQGISPIAHARAQEAQEEAAVAVQTTTFAVIADELLAKKKAEGKAVATTSKLEWLLGIAKADLGHRPVSEIKPAEVLAVLRKVEGRGHRETARRLRSLISECFRFAIATTRAELDPAAPLIGALTAPIVTPRPAITTATEFGALLRAISGYSGQPSTRAALELMVLLAPRPGELRMAEWSEVDFDKAVWTVPATRAKMRREHRVWLPPQALTILKDLRKITGHGKLLLPGVGMSGGEGRKVAPKPMSENTMNAALRRLGFDQSEMCSHGFRAAFSTLANESGLFSPDVVEAALAHVDADSVRRAYARGQHWPERIRLAQWWADECDRMRTAKPGRA